MLLLSLLFLATTPAELQETKMQEMKEIKAAAAEMSSAKSLMMIDPKERASDYIKAYQMLRGEKSATKVYFQLSGNRQISNIIDATPMPGGTMIVFRYTTPQGVLFQVVPVEDILGVHHQ